MHKRNTSKTADFDVDDGMTILEPGDKELSLRNPCKYQGYDAGDAYDAQIEPDSKGGAASNSYDAAAPLLEKRKEYLGSPKAVNLTHHSRIGIEAARPGIVTHSLDELREGSRVECSLSPDGAAPPKARRLRPMVDPHK